MAEWLPLFPLAGIVLFPGTAIPLRIFEERYVQMIQAALEGDRRFGVVLIREGEEVGEPAVPVEIGCVAKIEECREMAGRQYLVIASGQERFRILDTRAEGKLLLGRVELLVDAPDLPEPSELADEVAELAEAYLEIIRRLSRGMMGRVNLPREPELLSFLVAGSLHIPVEQRQSLLELESTRERLERLHQILANETISLRERVHVHEESTRIASTNGRLPEDHLRGQAGDEE